MSRINIAAKRSGDKLTANEFNAVVDAVNDNDSRIGANAQQITNIGNTISNMQQTQSRQGNALNTLVNEHIPHEFYTQSEYEVLVNAGRVNLNALTFVFED